MSTAEADIAGDLEGLVLALSFALPSKRLPAQVKRQGVLRSLVIVRSLARNDAASIHLSTFA